MCTKITSLLFIILISLSCTDSTGRKPENKSKTEKTSTGEIENILVYSTVNSADDGSFDSEEDYNNVTEDFKIKQIEDDTYYYCYDTENLFKIELLGFINNGKITFESNTGKLITLVKKLNFSNNYTISPSSKNDFLNGGTLTIYDNDTKIKELKIVYEGCL